ncbi:MAG: UDP-2,3-diacylglucosamine diphosphatase [Gemmatimonadota bacterium]
MREPVVFLSDVHLGGASAALEAAKEADLISFLEELSGDATLYLLGDIFEFWFEDGGPPPARYGAVLRALGRVTARGARVAFLGGNHDFWARTGGRPGFLEQALGIELLTDPHEVTHQGVRLLLTHGDALGGARGGYRAVRGVLRSPLAIAAFRRLPRAVRLGLAARTSATSRTRHTGPAQTRHQDALREAARAVLATSICDAVIAGHIHAPERVELPGGVYCNLGDWITHRTYARLDGGALTLETYRPSRRSR